MSLDISRLNALLAQWVDFAFGKLQSVPPWALVAGLVFLINSAFLALYIIILLAAPHPRAPTASEKKYKCILPDGSQSESLDLPCWYDTWKQAKNGLKNSKDRKGVTRQDEETEVEPAEVFLSVVIPAYNEQERLPNMLDEAVSFLQEEYPKDGQVKDSSNGSAKQRLTSNETTSDPRGWEILIVSDGSTDKTVETALEFANDHGLTGSGSEVIRVITLEKNRGKGGAVTHGMRHVRGKYVIFADADGASKFEDARKMIVMADDLAKKDPEHKGRAVVAGSRAHLVDSEAVVKRSVLRNLLMYTFHLFIRLLTTPKTSHIGDTQCGFKLFTRPALPYVVPYMHSEGWIFDVEMLMLTESANIPMQEQYVGWKEVTGSKLNVIWDSLGMAWGLFVVRCAWSMGIWSKS